MRIWQQQWQSKRATNTNPTKAPIWKQGQSSEQVFIFTHYLVLTVEALDSIRDEMHPGETLMICCKSFQKRM